ncbi:MAG TPA: hypothetical protein VM911_04770, partial [Pyrinomonadaceae bacterium]|nr:hypothetical protein [Pyrinomonadaceae bacterium]
DLKKSLDGVVASKDSKDLRRWAKDHAEKVSRTQKAKTKYHRGWAQDRVKDLERAVETGQFLEAKSRQRMGVNRILMEPDTYHTVYLAFDRPPNARVGQAFDVEVQQTDARSEKVIGGITVRVELVPEPKKARSSRSTKPTKAAKTAKAARSNGKPASRSKRKSAKRGSKK